MPVSVFETASDVSSAPVKTEVKPDVPASFIDYSGGNKNVLVVTSCPDDSMALVMRLSRGAVLLGSYVDIRSDDFSLRSIPGLVVVKQGVEQVGYEPEPGQVEFLKVEHFSEGVNN